MKHIQSKDWQFYAIVLAFSVVVGLITGNMNKDKVSSAAVPAQSETAAAETPAATGVTAAKRAETGSARSRFRRIVVELYGGISNE